MSQSYSGGDQSVITSNASFYCTHGGTDLGFLGQDASIAFPQSTAPRMFAQSKASYAIINTAGEAYIDGVMNQLTQALLLKLLQNATSLDSGNRIGVNGDFGIILDTASAWTYFLHNISGLPKRMNYPKATLRTNGALPIGSKVDELSIAFRMEAVKDNTAPANEQLLALYYNEDATAITLTPSPADAAAGVAVDAAVTVTFSLAIGADYQVTAAVNPYIYLINTTTGVTALTSVSWNAAGTVATLAHASFGATTPYVLIVSGEMRGDSGIKISGDGATSGTNLITNFTTV